MAFHVAVAARKTGEQERHLRRELACEPNIQHNRLII